jgi:hypothetical protein
LPLTDNDYFKQDIKKKIEKIGKLM